MARVYLSLGSNINREENICGALDALAAGFGGLLISSVYESAAVGFDGEPFFNLVVGLDTGLPVGALSRALRQIESDFGRQRGEAKFSARTLDIDILTYDEVVGVVEGIELPRDEILKYAFVLQPLAEIVPDACCPGRPETYAALWRDFADPAQALWPVAFSWRGRTLPCSSLS